MQRKKINIDLTGVPKTLLLPLAGRAYFSKKKNPLIFDERAVKLTEEINFDFNGLLESHGKANIYWWAARAYHFDQAIKNFLKSCPKAVIVNLGAGLETEFYRVDNGQLTWVDLDLPDVIELRKKLLPLEPRVHYLDSSILSNEWMEKVKPLGNHYFFVIGGLFMYFTEEQVKSILQKIILNFPKAEIVFDVISTRGLFYANQRMAKSGFNNATMYWGLDDEKILQDWFSTKIEVTKFPYFKNVKTRLVTNFSHFLKLCFYDQFDKGGVVHLKSYKDKQE